MSDGEALADLDAAGSLDPAERWRTCPTLADCSATNGHATLRPPAPTPNTRQPIRDPMQPDPIQLLTALQEIAPDILSAARSREVGERNATGEPGPTAELADAILQPVGRGGPRPPGGRPARDRSPKRCGPMRT